MLHVNVANVLNMLIILFQIIHIPPINEREIQLRDVIEDIITNDIITVNVTYHLMYTLILL